MQDQNSGWCYVRWMIATRSYLCLLSLLLFSFAPAAATQNETPPEGSGWVLKKADLDVSLEPKHKQLQVKAELRLRLEKLETSLGPTIGMNSRATVLKFEEVLCEGAEQIELNLPYPKLEAVRLARIRFAKPFKRGDEVTINATYRSTGETSQFTIAEDVVLASWVVGWHPVPLPVSSSESLNQLMQSVGTTRFHLPKGWRVVSNGTLSETRETDEGVIETWQVSTPVARSFVAAAFKATASFKIGARTVGVYAIVSNKRRAEDQAHVLVKALEAMESHFGPYPFPSYYIVEVPAHVPGFYGSSEQGFIITKPDAFIAGGNIALFAHEVAHGWWGNLITARGDGGILLTEALSQYSAVLAIEAINGKVSATEFMRFSQTAYSPWQCAKGYFGISREGHDRALSQISKGGGFDHHLADSKGMWFYHMLRQQVGDETFFATLRELLKRFAGKAITLADLREAFLMAAPRADLTTFFAQWLDRSGAPILEVKWAPPKNGKAEIIITQVQKGEPYVLKLELAIDTTDGRTRLNTIDVRGKETRVQLPLTGQIKQIRPDPNHRLLIWQPEYGARP
ncbi:MAG TPA: M1 family aminopeptidase [Pyrinomonadaceae bacterium]|nr:M1 family aminopeptidase [Pyrinomonadaceae bacterium]